jgi:hypothetical protein
MNSEEFTKLYIRQGVDESITSFANETGFSLIRYYPKDTIYFKDRRRMFIKVAVLDRDFFYSVNMTRPEKREESTSYIISDGNEYKRKITNFFSDSEEPIVFDSTTRRVVYRQRNQSFTLNEFVEILAANHLADRLFFKRKLNTLINLVLKILFWLSEKHYERVRVSIDKYHFSRENQPVKDEEKNIEPFFKYFYISKNILFAILLVAFPSAVFLGHLWAFGEFSLSNPSIVLLFFLILLSCEKSSIWLDKKIKEFFAKESREKKTNFIEKLYNYQYHNKFKLKLK